MKELTDLGELITTLESKNKEEWSILEGDVKDKKYSTVVDECTVVLYSEVPEKRTSKAISPDTFEVENIDISLPPKYCVEVRKGDLTVNNWKVDIDAISPPETYTRVDALFERISCGEKNQE